MPSPSHTATDPVVDRWQRGSAAVLRAFHAYANWLVSITWKRFAVLSVLLMVIVNILQSLPPFRWTWTETIEDSPSIRIPRIVIPPVVPPRAEAPAPPAAPRAPEAPASSEYGAASGPAANTIDIVVGGRHILVVPHGASAPASEADGAVRVELPEGLTKEAIRDVARKVRRAIRDQIKSDGEDTASTDELTQAAEEAAQAAIESAQDAIEAARDATDGALIRTPGGKTLRTRHLDFGEFLTQLAVVWIAASAIVKATYKGRLQAEARAAQASETAEAESLKRQVVEARMAAMQAQVEPHFLFNTLASIDHLIETDPKRASQMQKNLIALLRASMPTMREAGGDGGPRPLGRELSVIRPYLEILKVRMEERLATTIDVPDGLLSAEFPSMMIQTLVENAIKHGLEPKPEGGTLAVKAEIVHGNLQVSVADTGLGFGRAATAGTGVGLANIRERLQLLYGSRASLTVAENRPGGTVVTITVPYKTIEGATA